MLRTLRSDVFRGNERATSQREKLRSRKTVNKKGREISQQIRERFKKKGNMAEKRLGQISSAKTDTGGSAPPETTPMLKPHQGRGRGEGRILPVSLISGTGGHPPLTSLCLCDSDGNISQVGAAASSVPEPHAVTSGTWTRSRLKEGSPLLNFKITNITQSGRRQQTYRLEYI